MSIGLILIIVAGILALLDIVLWNSGRGYNRYVLTPAAVILICIALLIGGGAIH